MITAAADAIALTTAQLEIRPLDEGDVDALHRLADEFEVARWTADIPHPYSREDAEAFVAHAIELFRDNSGFAFAMTAPASDGALVGSIDLQPVGDREAEIGYWVGLPYQGRGYASEAVKAVLGFAAETLAVERIWARVAQDNLASIRVLEKNGMRLKGRGTQFWKSRGTDMPIARYAILAKDLKR